MERSCESEGLERGGEGVGEFPSIWIDVSSQRRDLFFFFFFFHLFPRRYCRGVVNGWFFFFLMYFLFSMFFPFCPGSRRTLVVLPVHLSISLTLVFKGFLSEKFPHERICLRAPCGPVSHLALLWWWWQ